MRYAVARRPQDFSAGGPCELAGSSNINCWRQVNKSERPGGMRVTTTIFGARLLLFLLLLLFHKKRVSAFTAPRAPKPQVQENVVSSFIKSIQTLIDNTNDGLGKGSSSSSASILNKKRADLKNYLLMECRSTDEKKDGNKRKRIESIIGELEQIRPTERTATSPLLQKKWLLEWTTEKEINVFSDWGISGMIYQTINGDELGNMIEFKKGGGLGVRGCLSIPEDDERGVRTSFKFTSATLDLGRWGKYNIPPVGEGWFDTVYLDDELRVDTNSRDDILICTPL